MILSKSKLILLFLLSLLTISSCKKDDQTRLQAGWTSQDPILIPYNIRNHERVLGNLVLNPSFETGRVYYEESNIKSYDIDGWKKVGRNISWINAQNGKSEYNPVFDGIYSVKIERTKADETEEKGEGIISDFIKVIPGNYSLKLHLKLKDVYPNQSRLGTKIYNAINISLEYYDKNKIRISGEELDPFTQVKLDNSFKAFSLSNYSHIKDFGWGEIFGKTANFPFFDGDIPDDARYVKIFIGLRGTGTMWVDKVDFRYTRDNFTLLERVKPYFDSSYLMQEKIYPNPQQTEILTTKKYYNPDSAQYPAILIPKNATATQKKMAKDMRDFLINGIKECDSLQKPEIQITSELKTINKNQFTISIGETQLYNEYIHILPDTIFEITHDSYYIQETDSVQNVVFINAGSNESFKYAFQTISQLFDPKKADYFGVNIIDYPDFEETTILINEFGNDLAEFERKIDLLYQYKMDRISFNWDNQADNFSFNSFYNLTGKKLKFGAYINLSENTNISPLSELFSGTFTSILLSSDDSLDCNEFDINKKCSDHFDIVNEFNKQIKKRKIETKLGYLPRWNNLESIDEGYEDVYFYFYNLNQSIPRNVDLYWTGPSKYTESLDCAELLRINNIYNRFPYFIDNTLLNSDIRFKSIYINQYYAGKIRTQSLIEPSNLRLCKKFLECCDNKKVIINTKEFSDLELIRLLTIQDYYWNSESYNPEKSLWIILNKLYGKNVAINLLYLNDAYFGLKEICQKIENIGLQHKNSRIARNFADMLVKYFDELKSNGVDPNLLEELKVYKHEILDQYNDLISQTE